MTKLLTGNDLLTGDVLWWTGSGWSLHLGEAVAVDDDHVLQATIMAERINDPALIDAEPAAGGWRPRTMRERIRGAGPTVRPDLNRMTG